jgi:preprotein translocase subunit SecD
VVISGTLPGVQVVEVAKLPKADQQAIASWIAVGEPADKAPALAAGTYTPMLDGHVLIATKDVGSSNGIAVSQVTLQFDPDGTKLLADFTTAHPGAMIAVALGGRVVMTAEPADPITTGQIVIDSSREIVDSIAKQIVVAK